MDRSTRIANIIDARRPLVQRIDSVLANLRTLDEALQSLEEERGQLLERVSDPLANARLKGLDMQAMRARIESEVGSLSKLRTRFARETINIGVIGRARQGKSRLLQSISGLTTNEIPDGSGSHCTGVRSTIYHDPQSSPHGEVFFHSEKSFITDMISPYFRELKLGAMPRNAKEFAARPLPSLPIELASYAGPGAKYEHLKKYRERFEQFAALLGASPRRIPITQIREYVAQDTVDGQGSFFNYLGVNHVKVFCRFPHEEVGRIAFCDMVGLGDTGVGDEARMIKVLGEEVDVVLFVKLPKATGDFWAKEDVDLYDIARNALTDLPIERWSFMVLNRTASNSAAGDNEANCRRLATDIASKHIHVANCLIANCANSGEVSEQVLDTVLNYLAEHLSSLDAQYTSICQDRLNQFVGELAVVLEDASGALGRGAPVEGEFEKFDQLFKAVWNDLTNSLEQLLTSMRAWSREPNNVLEQQFEASIERCRNDTGIPSIDEIARTANMYGAYNTAFNQALHKVRTHMVQHFLSLEDTLRVSLEGVRSQVAMALRNDGRLTALSSSEGTAFLQDMGRLIPKELLTLRNAFQTLAGVELTYRGFLQYRMRPHLMHLHPNGKDGEQIRIASNPLSVQETLEVLHDRVINRLESAFEKWLSEPNQVAEAIVEEFVDNVLRAERAHDEWRSFYLEMRATVWQAEFDQLGALSRLRHDWDQVVGRAREANQTTALRILN
jgi:hypothetical protein